MCMVRMTRRPSSECPSPVCSRQARPPPPWYFAMNSPVAAHPSAEELRSAMSAVLVGKDLGTMALKMLRQSVTDHMGSIQQTKRMLAETRRIEFSGLAQQVIRDMQAAANPPPQAPPDWLVLEDEEAPTAIYLVTFAGILPDTIAAATTPLRALDGVGRANNT